MPLSSRPGGWEAGEGVRGMCCWSSLPRACFLQAERQWLEQGHEKPWPGVCVPGRIAEQPEGPGDNSS